MWILLSIFLPILEISENLGRSVEDCVLQNHPECLYSGIIAQADFKDQRVADLRAMDLNRIK